MANYTAVTNPLIITVGENTTVRPIFSAAPAPTPTPSPVVDPTYTITLITNNAAGGTVGGTSPTTPLTSTVIVAKIGEQVSFSAQESAGYDFVGWYLNNSLWSTNRTPRILTNQNQTFEARFTQKVVEPTCTCYFVQPITPGTSFQITYRKCKEAAVVTETFQTFTNICSENIPQAGTNALVPQNLNTNCTNNGSCGSPPPTPTPSLTPAPTSTPAITPTPSRAPDSTPPAATPQPSSTPVPTPTPSPGTWKSCIDGTNTVGNPPSGFRQAIYLGDDLGTVCWEPVSDLGFVPSLNNITFDYQRGSSIFPPKKEFSITNPSYSVAYNVRLVVDNNLFVIEPTPTLVVPPRQTIKFRVGLNQANISRFGDGQTRFEMRVETTEVVR